MIDDRRAAARRRLMRRYGPAGADRELGARALRAVHEGVARRGPVGDDEVRRLLEEE